MYRSKGCTQAHSKQEQAPVAVAAENPPHACMCFVDGSRVQVPPFKMGSGSKPPCVQQGAH